MHINTHGMACCYNKVHKDICYEKVKLESSSTLQIKQITENSA